MTKTFRIDRMTKALIRKLYANLLTINAGKIGRNRRGRLLLSSFNARREEDGKLVVTLTWKHCSGCTRFLTGILQIQRSRIKLYKFSDHKLLMKGLGSL